MGRVEQSLYGGRVTLAARIRAAVRATWSRSAWRALYQCAGATVLSAVAGTVTGLWLVVWGAAAFSLADETNDWSHRALYVVVALAGPIPLLWCVQGFGELQRSRLRSTVGVIIPAPPRATGTWLLRPWRAWAAASTWRQFGYLAWAAAAGAPAGAVVILSWLAPALIAIPVPMSRTQLLPVAVVPRLLVILAALVLFVAAPWLARGLSRLDTWLAQRLLGPSRSERLVQRVEALSRSRAEVVEAADAERRRIERDLHDGVQLRLVSLAMNLGLARMTLPDTQDPARQAIEQAHEDAIATLTELREVVRGLHPAILNDRGLDAALSGIVARAPLPVRLRVSVPDRCPPSIEAVAYFVVSEALTNVVKHAQASSAEVTVTGKGDWLQIVVTDNGRGGARLAYGGAGGTISSGTGLLGLAQRAQAADGTLTLDSPVGGPTTLTVRLPCE
jgi:signal transduction histidine kinase